MDEPEKKETQGTCCVHRGISPVLVRRDGEYPVIGSIYLKTPKGKTLGVLASDIGDDYLRHSAMRYTVELYSIEDDGSYDSGRPLRACIGTNDVKEALRNIAAVADELQTGQLKVVESDDGIEHIYLKHAKPLSPLPSS